MARKKVVRRPRSGFGLIPVDKGFNYVKDYFHIDVDKKDLSSALKSYVKKNYAKDSKYILANPEYSFTMFTHYCATAWWSNMGLDASSGKFEYYHQHLVKYVEGLIESGKDLFAKKQKEAEEQKNVVVLTPQQRLMIKVNQTILSELDDLEDEWINGEKTTIDLYNRFRYHGLKGQAVNVVREYIEGWLLDYSDAYHKKCPQAVEGYSHLKRTELKRRMKACEDMLADCDRIKAAAKATRKVKVARPKAADKQVAKVQYKPEDREFKLVSINPIMMVGKQRLYVFNSKYRTLTEYVTEAGNGFEISGSTIKNFNKVDSRQVKLRKPEEFLALVQKKTPKQIDAAWKKLTTKTTVPNGRLNKETILLRAV